jgi:ribosome-associated toxin RatA of RatAB toxin-antitoxin module
MPRFGKLCRWALGGCGFIVLTILGVPFSSIPEADFSSRLAQGEIIYHSVDGSESGAKRGDATGVVAAPPDKVWQVVADFNNYQKFMPRMVRSRLVRFKELERIVQEGPASAGEVESFFGPSPPDLAQIRVPGEEYRGYYYAQAEVPWPLRNRWYIARVLWDESQATHHIYTCSWSLITGNLQKNSGEWKVEPFGDNQTQLTYQVEIDVGGFVPKFLVEEFTTQTLPQIIAAVRRRVSSY